MVREVLIEYPYLLILMNLWPEAWKNKLEMMNMKIDKENEKDVLIVNE